MATQPEHEGMRKALTTEALEEVVAAVMEALAAEEVAVPS